MDATKVNGKEYFKDKTGPQWGLYVSLTQEDLELMREGLLQEANVENADGLALALSVTGLTQDTIPLLTKDFQGNPIHNISLALRRETIDKLLQTGRHSTTTRCFGRNIPVDIHYWDREVIAEQYDEPAAYLRRASIEYTITPRFKLPIKDPVLRQIDRD